MMNDLPESTSTVIYGITIIFCALLILPCATWLTKYTPGNRSCTSVLILVPVTGNCNNSTPPQI